MVREAPALTIRAVGAPPTLDGKLDEVDWQTAARTGPMLAPASREIARPYSEVRFAYDERALYLALYAADEDIRATATHDGPVWLGDAFSVRLQTSGGFFGLDLAPNGAITDFRQEGGRRDLAWESGAQLGIDVDETLNQGGDIDEEWVVEVALPWSALGLSRVPESLGVSVRRCDTLADHSRRCGQWGEATRGEVAGRLVLAR